MSEGDAMEGTGSAATMISRTADANRGGSLLIPAALGGLALVLHLATNAGYDFFRDEFYYIACGRHLAWGYVDHPPLVALLADLGRALFGNSLAGLRALPAL